jgi:hypothetical protein
MALTKVQRTGISDNSIDADKIEDGTIVAADIAPGTITNALLTGSIANDKLANSSFTINGSSVSLGGNLDVNSVNWQSLITADGSTTTTAVAGEGYIIDTTSNTHTVNLPASPSIGDKVVIKDYAGTFGTNNVTINRNGNNIQGVANNSLISTNRASLTLVYVDATKGWLYTNESNVGDLREPVFTSATGGTITTSGDYKIHSFTGDGCFVVSSLGNAPANPAGGPNAVSYLVVAGGGGGGNSEANGGGGAGGLREGRVLVPEYTASPLVTSGLTITATTYPITVGGGGAIAGKGSDSIFSTITSAGGGGGGPNPQAAPQLCKARGGSGSGGGRSSCSPSPRQTSGGAGNYPPVSPPQGNPGGSSDGGTTGGEVAGGGGGAGATGSNYSPSSGGPGGVGVQTNIDTRNYYYSGGGGGGTEPKGNPSISAGSGGNGGGGAGVAGAGTAISGGENSGGGGGGAGWAGPPCAAKVGGSGGKGIVIIRYKYQ